MIGGTMFLLAESVTLDLGTILTIGGIVFGAGGVIAGLKIKAVMAENKTKDVGKQSEKANEKLERVDERIFTEIKDLGKTMQRRFNEQDQRQVDAEKSMVGKLDNFQSKVFHRLDDVQGQLSEQDKRLTVAETEARHTRETVDKHGKKITMYGKAAFKMPERDS
jgi:hypothetical protein